MYGSRHLASIWERDDKEGVEDVAKGLRSISSFVLLDLLGTKDAGNPTLSDNKRPVVPLYSSATRHLYSRLQNIESALFEDGLRKVKGHRSNHYFSPSGNTRLHHRIEDDHIPFLSRNVPVLHIIPVPFPSVWHTRRDNIDSIDWNVVEDQCLIFRCFVADYLDVALPLSPS